MLVAQHFELRMLEPTCVLLGNDQNIDRPPLEGLQHIQRRSPDIEAQARCTRGQLPDDTGQQDIKHVVGGGNGKSPRDQGRFENGPDGDRGTGTHQCIAHRSDQALANGVNSIRRPTCTSRPSPK